jgi:predicted acylesterase/phospholipase RssA
MFKILSLDGGGIKGVFEAAFLAEVESSVKPPLASYFDLIAGTSTGGIIALGLGLGIQPVDLLGFYKSYGPDIFERPRGRLANLFHWCKDKITCKYGEERLRHALERTLGDRRLGDSCTRLVVPAFNLSAGEIHVYKTCHHPRFQTDYKVRAVDVALATTAAPTYFPVHKSECGMLMIDGGIWANNPTGMAVIEAVAVLDIPRSEIEVLSLGSTQETSDFTSGGSGELHWARRALDCAMSGQSFGALGTAALLIGHEHILRIDRPVASGRFSLDSASGIDELEALGRFEARKALPKLMATVLAEHAPPFKPMEKMVQVGPKYNTAGS